ncbi:hypothetical protein GUJ93_ZPchr0013g37495 [Zizania palustris]|uniref:Uncharacterized protein n=1 Tax=Zizania palustris TaxID=103762 RepID=A0A8J6C4Y6_ZIZPA|nr:hypothetical protein GUJ93_ZPchr0013g37495 [Zizania palustris]
MDGAEPAIAAGIAEGRRNEHDLASIQRRRGKEEAHAPRWWWGGSAVMSAGRRRRGGGGERRYIARVRA